MAPKKAALKTRKTRAKSGSVRRRASASARDEAQTSSDYSRAIVETIHEAQVVVDSEYRVSIVNRSFCDLFHVSFQDMVGQPLFAVGGGQWNIPDLRKLFTDILPKNAQIKDFEIDQEFPQIGRRYLVLNARQIETSKTILIAIEDFTERKRALEEAEGKEATIRALLVSTTQSIVAVDSNEKIILVNGSVTKMFGYRKEELIGQKLDILVPERARGRHSELHKVYFANMQSRPMGIGLELEGRRWDGTTFPVEIGLGPVETPYGKFAVAFVNDISWRKQVETTLRQREHEISALLDNSPDVILRLDREERYAYVNASTARVAGMPPEALLGKTPRQAGMPESLCDLWSRTFRSVLDSGLPQVIEFPFPSPGSETIWEERWVPEFAADGIVESALVIGRDISERRKLEKVAQIHAEEVRALAARLLTAQEDERRRVSRELHDQICQQLASLAIDIGGLAASPPSPEDAPSRLKALQGRIVKASEEARHLAYELHPSMLDDLGLVASLRALCKEFSAHNLDTVLKFSGGALPASVPREVASCVFRVAQEALQNIAKHSKAKNASVALGVEKGAVVLTIADDGAGFDVDAVKSCGGLGLIGAEERARLLNGEVTIRAQPGRGTQIGLKIPCPENRR